ncbi:hypothetical protein OAS19_04430 [Altererythrobacter sp.]|nr:hypothetical protein [Altererythrobacter sp.]
MRAAPTGLIGDAQSIKTFLLGSACPIALLRRGLLIPEGTAVEINGDGTLLIGISGAGKIAFAARMGQLGHRVIFDGICVIDDTGHALEVHAPMKIWRDDAE